MGKIVKKNHIKVQINTTTMSGLKTNTQFCTQILSEHVVWPNNYTEEYSAPYQTSGVNYFCKKFDLDVCQSSEYASATHCFIQASENIP